jgi:dihydrofolate synthase/folylpolyglutamate synthase
LKPESLNSPTPNQFEKWLIQALGKEVFRPGLERVEKRLLPQLEAVRILITTGQMRVTTIAGTNGKGETSYALAELAKKAQRRYCLWTSPHILSVTERFQSEEGNIAEEELKASAEDFLHELKSTQSTEASSLGLSYYEFLWGLFLRWCLKRKPQELILEVGMGGRLDAVNLLEADCVLLTSISRDHQEFLGPTYRQILFEKLGVTRPYKKLLSCLELGYLRTLTNEHCQKFNIDWKDLDAELSPSLKFHFSYRNRFLAFKAAQTLGWLAESASFTDFYSAKSFQGRGEKWILSTRSGQSLEWIFYGSHNVDGLRKFCALFRSQARNTQDSCEDSFYNLAKLSVSEFWVSFSQRPLQDLVVMTKTIHQLTRVLNCPVRWFEFDHPKAQSLAVLFEETSLAPLAKQKIFHIQKDLESLVESYQLSTTSSSPATPEKCIIVVGSYYFVAALQTQLRTLGAKSHSPSKASI